MAWRPLPAAPFVLRQSSPTIPEGGKLPRVCVFDVNETLPDMCALDTNFKVLFGSEDVRTTWFGQVIQSALVATVTDSYTPFSEVSAAALEMIEPLAERLSNYFHYFGVRGAFLMQLGRTDEARVAFDRAIALANSSAEAAHIRMHLDRLMRDSKPRGARAGK